jgi:uncharacterized membrane protein YedE/YeeE
LKGVAELKKWILAFLFALIAVILLGAALMMPWYYITHKPSYEAGVSAYTESTYEYELQEVTMKTQSYTVTKPYTNTEFEDSKMVPVFNNTFYLTILALIMAILLMVFSILGGIKGGKMPLLGVIFGLLAFIFALFAPMYMMIGIPAAVEEEWKELKKENPDLEKPKLAEYFFGEETEGTGVLKIHTSWGGSTGWYLSVAAFVFALLAFMNILAVWRFNVLEAKRQPFVRSIGTPPPQEYPEQRYTPPLYDDYSPQVPDENYPSRPRPPPPPPPQY